ncbi:MAG: 2-succinyl-5-enolpyruvyl-6-hydroxy-3-cyclohexene-1-carboxylic-acid synthase [Bacteroidota bacterium]
MIHSAVFNTSEICFQLGVRHAVLSPGSRNAPLTISFARNHKIKKWVIPDERAAGFVALGIAQEVKEPVVLCCTSGTALLNYGPAVAEAYYRQIPLIVLSADRPPELIDQRDGQTIRQFEALKNHVKLSKNLPVVASGLDAVKYREHIKDAISTALELPGGPVHINIPFREPIYPPQDASFEFETSDQNIVPKTEVQQEFQLPKVKKLLVLVGQQEPDPELNNVIKEVSGLVPIIKSPLNNLESGINAVDSFIDKQQELVPDLLITSGLSVLSKKLKNFLRRNTPEFHLHFDEAGVSVDTYNSSPQLLQASISTVLKQLQSEDYTKELDPSYRTNWLKYEKTAIQVMKDCMKDSAFSEASASKVVLELIPEGALLHLSNSMPVRYADLFFERKHVTVRSNRGTSGIDGCTSTAVGNTLSSHRLNFLLTGDLAFLYDRNAFFHNYLLPNLRIIIMNNQGGGIFRLIDGPSNLPELSEYFETSHQRTAKYVCEENQIDYLPVRSLNEITDQWNEFTSPSKHAKVMEVFTDPSINQEVYKNFRRHLNGQLNQLEKSS